MLIDQEMVYARRQGNDRLLLGLKGSLNEYELDLLRQRYHFEELCDGALDNLRTSKALACCDLSFVKDCLIPLVYPMNCLNYKFLRLI